MSKKSDHGKHNKDLCDIIPNSHNDWIITTAFYACIHYIDHALFPVVHNGVTYNSIEEWHVSLKPRSRSPHESRKILVNYYLNHQYPNFKHLFSSCMNARYVDYVVANSQANFGKKRLRKS